MLLITVRICICTCDGVPTIIVNIVIVILAITTSVDRVLAAVNHSGFQFLMRTLPTQHSSSPARISPLSF